MYRFQSIFAFVFIPYFGLAQNIALNKSYTLSADPNYFQSAPANDRTSLTDGIYTKGNYWSKLTTVGWQRRQVTIILDLGEIEPLGAITFDTFRNLEVGISFPKNIFIFISKDNKIYNYIGDAADTLDNLPGPYKIEKFTLKNFNSNARYIALYIIPSGPYLFCDEIEVLKSKVIDSDKNVAGYDKDHLSQAVDSLKSIEYNRKNLSQAFKRVQDISMITIGKSDENLSPIAAQINDKNISENKLREIKIKIGENNASLLRNKYDVPFIFEKYNPWDSLGQFRLPNTIESSLNYKFALPKGGVQYGSFVITNSSLGPKKFLFKVSNEKSSLQDIELFDVPFVPSINFSMVADPLIPIDNEIIIPSGFSEQFIFKILGKNIGAAKSMITIRSGGIIKYVTIGSDIRILFPPNNMDNLNANNWVYLNFPMLKDRQKEAGEDLDVHHINTVDIPPGIFPYMEQTNDSIFINYLRNLKEIKNFLILTNYSNVGYRNGYGGGQFMSEEWKMKFIKWYLRIVEIIHKNGFPNSNVYFYPYDEVSGGDISDFKQLINWARKEIPGIRFFATLGNKPAIDTILPLIDIAQIQASYIGLNDLPKHSCEVWTYNGSSPSRALSPYSFYRLMAWQAFVNGFKGIGFWDYADEGRDKQLNLITDPLINTSSSYSVIYDGPGKEIISTRRWEAFKLGIEDYSILNAFSRKYGFEKAKSIAKMILDDIQNFNLADKLRGEMIKALTE